MSCLDETTVARLVAGELEQAEVALLEDHLDRCEACRHLVAVVARVASPGDQSDPGSAPTEAAQRRHEALAPLLPPGATLGRYQILERIGAGGMGTVYAAFDPELGRRVAIKVLRPQTLGSEDAAQGSQRLRREAQALASLSHPNIVTVFDVGAHEEQVFLAMELVDGLPMSRWLRERPRSWRDVRDVLLAAGRGLEAAHAAGLVHRDFKPDNVLIGNDGRVRVTDFGLARSFAAADRGPGQDGDERAPDPARSAPALSPDVGLTRSGLAVGTPAYMAPEQHRGRATDARTDQFGFCVALFEGLFGLRPFEGTTAAEIAREVLSGRMPAIPRSSRVPAWLGRIVARGLRTDPAERYPSMAALLADLSYEPARARRRALLAAGALVAVGLAAALPWALGGGPGPCEALERRLDGVWDAARRTAARRAFAATRRPFAPKAWQSAAAILDGYALRWVAARKRACEAAQDAPAAGVAARTVQCVEGRLAQLRAVSEAFVGADARTVERAVVTASGLGSLRSCEDSRRLPPPEPESQVIRAQVGVLRAELARARVLLEEGKYEQSRAVSHKAVEVARRLGYAPTLAEAWFRLGEAQQRLRRLAPAQRSLQEAVLAAEGSGHEEIVARARVSLTWVVGPLQGKVKEAEVLARYARAALSRMGGDGAIEARLEGILADLYSRQHRIEEALRHARRSLALRVRVLGPNHIAISHSLTTLAITHARAARYAEALPHFQRVLAIRERALGPRHPLVAGAYNNLGILWRRMGKLSKSVDALRRAVAIARSLGDKLPTLARDLGNLGNTLFDLGQPAQALAAYREELAIRRSIYPPGHVRILETQGAVGNANLELGRVQEAARIHRQVVSSLEKGPHRSHPRVAVALNNLALAELRAGRLGVADAAVKRAVAVGEKHGREHPRMASLLLTLGRVARARGRPEEAKQAFERGIRIRRRAHPKGHWRLAELLVALGEMGLELEPRDRRAADLATEATAILGRVPSRPTLVARARFLLARATWAPGRGQRRALELARQARAGLGSTGAATRLRAEIDRWLARPRRTRPSKR